MHTRIGLSTIEVGLLSDGESLMHENQLKALTTLDTGTSGSYYFDAFESRRTTCIGGSARREAGKTGLGRLAGGLRQRGRNDLRKLPAPGIKRGVNPLEQNSLGMPGLIFDRHKFGACPG